MKLIHSALVAGQYFGLDEENLQKKFAEWKFCKLYITNVHNLISV